MLNVSAIRERFPALQRTYEGRSVVYFDGPGGSQVVDSCIDAIAGYMKRGGGNLHGVFPTSTETEAVLKTTRQSVAAFLGVQPEEVAFGPNMTTLTFSIARALARTWKAGDEIFVSELDHRANVDPFIQAAEDRGVTVKWLRVDPLTLTLKLDDLDTLFSSKTKLVAVGRASNAVGTITDVRRIADYAHQFGALVVVDAVHAVPHIPVRRDELAADILLCSAYKFFGPHVGIAAIRHTVFSALQPYKLLPAPNILPEKLETGTQNHEGIAGIQAAIAFLAAQGEGENLERQLFSAMQQIHAAEAILAEQLRIGLRAIPGITVFSPPDSVERTPTIAFRAQGLHPRAVCEWMLKEAGIFIADGDFYATTLADRLGISASGGWVRAGLAVYNTQEEVNTFLTAINKLPIRS